jgi:hypothetical protein
VNSRADLLALREQLSQLGDRLRELFDDQGAEPVSEVHATVTAAVPNSVPVRAQRRPEV